jgi:hypothetical protein
MKAPVRAITRNSFHEEYYEELEDARARHLDLAKSAQNSDIVIYRAQNYDWMKSDELFYAIRWTALR